jgi:pimeloyl-ACP methyl ester carboxylesterase
MAKFPDIVIFVPGILGSVLMKDDRVVWNLSATGLWRGAATTALTFDAVGSLDDDIGDGISAVRVVNNVGMVPGLWKVGYSNIREHLIDELGLQHGRNYFEFPYDWRRDNRVSAQQLARKSAVWLKDWREESGNENARIWLVAHSMGGLVSRYFIEQLEGWKNVRALVTLGTPYRGAVKALDFLTNGSSGLKRFVRGFELFQNFDSVYQLLPTYPSVRSQGEWVKVDNVTLPNVNRDRVADAMAFHAEVQTARQTNLRNDEYLNHEPRLSVVIGTDQATLQSATLDSDFLQVLRTDFRGKNIFGDGTVPRVSALPMDYTDQVATFVCNSHAALASDKATLHHVRSLLSGAHIESDLYRDEPGPDVRLLVDDVYDASEPVEIRAASSVFQQTIPAKIMRIDAAGETIETTLFSDGTSNFGQMDLLQGLYRVTVDVDGVQVSDIFSVINR